MGTDRDDEDQPPPPPRPYTPTYQDRPFPESEKPFEEPSEDAEGAADRPGDDDERR